MLRNYLTIAIRALRRHPGYAAINVFGLALGLAVCILIGFYVQDELSYDDFHTDADRAYRVLRQFDVPDLKSTITNTPPALAPALDAQIPEVERSVRVARTSSDIQYGVKTNVVPKVVFVPGTSGTTQRDTQKYRESGFVWAEPGFFDVFSFPLARGTAALGRPGTVVLTDTMATKYFPNADPIGKTLRVGDRSLEVTGVMADPPDNSHLKYLDFVGSLPTLNLESGSGWGFNRVTTYVTLAEHASKMDVTARIDEVVRSNDAGSDAPGENSFIPHLQPITGIHFGQGVPVEVESSGNILYVYIFGGLAIFVLLLSCMNFVNLSTARGVERANEVGLRKALGAGRRQLIRQLLGESIVMSVGGLAVALVLCRVGLPLLNQLADKSLAFGTLVGPGQMLALVGLAVLVGLLAGSYPALMLSRFEPTRTLKGDTPATRGHRLRRVLVVTQFAISIAILVGTGVVHRQLDFMQQADLGFDDDNLIVVDNVEYLDDQRETFMQEVNQISGVERVASGYSMPSTLLFSATWAPAQPGAERQEVNYSFVGWNYVETLDLELAAGRTFSRAAASDSLAVLLNEAAAEAFGWTPEEAIGKRLPRKWPQKYTVVGVTENFHYQSLRTEIEPLVLLPPLRQQHRVAVRVQPGNVTGSLDAIRNTWERFSDFPLTYSFLTDDLSAQYRNEARLASVFSVFAGLAVLVACLGLLGLAAYTTQRRTKEIGIRKAVGATTSRIVRLLSTEFAKLVLLAFVVAAPVAYVAMRTWLSDFAYHVDLGPWVFLGAGTLTLVLALLTVSVRAVRAARTDPATTLRDE